MVHKVGSLLGFTGFMAKKRLGNICALLGYTLSSYCALSMIAKLGPRGKKSLADRKKFEVLMAVTPCSVV